MASPPPVPHMIVRVVVITLSGVAAVPCLKIKNGVTNEWSANGLTQSNQPVTPRLLQQLPPHLEAVDVDHPCGDLHVKHREHGGRWLAREPGVQPRVEARSVVALDHRAEGGPEERVGLRVLWTYGRADGGGGVVERKRKKEKCRRFRNHPEQQANIFRSQV